MDDPADAEVVIMHEAYSFKEWRYIDRLTADPFVSPLADRIFVVNTDDHANGLVRGLYTCVTRRCFDPARHRAVPYPRFPNRLVLEADGCTTPIRLAAWRGDLKTNGIRPKLLRAFGDDVRFDLQVSNSGWRQHGEDEQRTYVEMIRGALFSLCPAGWAPASYRIYESMALARCPVILADGFERPRGIAWEDFALFVAGKDVRRLDRILESHRDEAVERGRVAREEWERVCQFDRIWDYYARQLLELVGEGSGSDVAAERRRWKSRELRVRNGWTIPQRLVRKIKRVFS